MKLRLAAAAAVVLVSVPAYAHFHLDSPPADQTQSTQGDPQKAAPCGAGTSATGMVSVVKTGSVLPITITETIMHPGHYRVAIAQTPAELPAEPTVKADSNSPCGSVDIDPAPALPVLADGELVHTQTLVGPQTFNVQLPADFRCDNCTVQVIEFMSNHPLNNPGGCFYHHCATVTISDNAPDAGVTGGGGGDDAGTSTRPTTDARGGCSTSGSLAGGGTALAMVGLALLVARRRSRSVR